MLRRLSRTAALVALISTLSVALLLIDASGIGSPTGKPTQASPAVESVSGSSVEAMMVEASGQTVELVHYLDAKAEAERQELEALEAERRRQAAATRPTNSAPAYHPGTTDGECTGFAVPDWIIQRESGGNPSAYNQSGAYGCAQTLLSHYADGRTCGGLDPFMIDGQRECVWRLSNGGTNLQPWAVGG